MSEPRNLSEQVCTPRSSLQLHQQPTFSLGAHSSASSTRSAAVCPSCPRGSRPPGRDAGAAGRRRWPKGRPAAPHLSPTAAASGRQHGASPLQGWLTGGKLTASGGDPQGEGEEADGSRGVGCREGGDGDCFPGPPSLGHPAVAPGNNLINGKEMFALAWGIALGTFEFHPISLILPSHSAFTPHPSCVHLRLDTALRPAKGWLFQRRFAMGSKSF